MRHVDGYLASPEGQLTLQRQREARRIYFSIKGVEPRAKHSMPAADKDRVQAQLLGQLVKFRRAAFRGPVALLLTLATTDKTPTQSHNIAKNLLDLFGSPRSTLATKRRGLLYADDRQVQALSVTCQHDQAEPTIMGVARPLGVLLEELEVVRDCPDDDDDDLASFANFGRTLDDLRDLRREKALRARLGEAFAETLDLIYRQELQRDLLGRSRLEPKALGYLFGAAREYGFEFEEIWKESPLRILLSELPQSTDASKRWKQEIEEKLGEFQQRYGALLNPLVVPVALEVVIKPPPPSRQNGEHDLDNILRRYLIPRVVDILKPPSALPVGVDQTPQQLLGVTRYQALRFPPACEGSSGFVCLALVCDLNGSGDVFCRLDRGIDRWEDSLT